jgi:hypothetical protein
MGGHQLIGHKKENAATSGVERAALPSRKFQTCETYRLNDREN